MKKFRKKIILDLAKMHTLRFLKLFLITKDGLIFNFSVEKKRSYTTL